MYGAASDGWYKTHRSTTDPDARLLRKGKGKGKEARLVLMGHALMENRHGLLVDFQVTHATGTAERDLVPNLLDEAKGRRFHPRPSAGTRATTPVTAWRTCGIGGSPRTSPGTPADDAAPSTGGPSAIPATP
jgi:hypothetical protein